MVAGIACQSYLANRSGHQHAGSACAGHRQIGQNRRHGDVSVHWPIGQCRVHINGCGISDEAAPDGDGGGRGAGWRVQLGEDAGDVSAHGANADEQDLGDLPVGLPFDEEAEDVDVRGRSDHRRPATARTGTCLPRRRPAGVMLLQRRPTLRRLRSRAKAPHLPPTPHRWRVRRGLTEPSRSSCPGSPAAPIATVPRCRATVPRPLREPRRMLVITGPAGHMRKVVEAYPDPPPVSQALGQDNDSARDDRARVKSPMPIADRPMLPATMQTCRSSPRRRNSIRTSSNSASVADLLAPLIWKEGQPVLRLGHSPGVARPRSPATDSAAGTLRLRELVAARVPDLPDDRGPRRPVRSPRFPGHGAQPPHPPGRRGHAPRRGPPSSQAAAAA